MAVYKVLGRRISVYYCCRRDAIVCSLATCICTYIYIYTFVYVYIYKYEKEGRSLGLTIRKYTQSLRDTKKITPYTHA